MVAGGAIPKVVDTFDRDFSSESCEVFGPKTAVGADWTEVLRQGDPENVLTLESHGRGMLRGMRMVTSGTLIFAKRITRQLAWVGPLGSRFPDKQLE